MTWNPWRALRVAGAALEAAHGQIQREVKRSIELAQELHNTHADLAVERAKRIAAESVSAERRAEMDRLLQQNRTLHEDFNRLMGERLRSVDALNLKLMEPRIEERPPDMEKFKALNLDAKRQMVSEILQANRNIDYAMLGTMHPKFGNLAKRTKQEPQPDVEIAGGI